MRNILIKAVLFMGVTLVLGTTGEAQTSGVYRADIPFDFTVNNTSYSAGEYNIRPLGNSSSALTIVNRKTGIARVIGLTHAGNMRGEDGKLMFEKVNGVFALTRVATPLFELWMKAPKSDERLASNISRKKETATVPLGH
jgi:hypothetical protein